jgi:uncharacterized protein
LYHPLPGNSQSLARKIESIKMIYSRYNIFSKIRESENYFIMNLLSGSTDILSSEDAEKVKAIQIDNNFPYDDFVRELAGKGYLMDSDEEARLYRQKYLDFIDSRDKDEIQLFFITNFSCNFACSYCYQDQYNNPKQELSIELIDSFFQYIQSKFAGRKKYITVFGGEPLLNNTKQKTLLKHLIENANGSNLEICFVTNGYTLEEYIPILKSGKIREIQVTLDGTEAIHNKRRFLKGGAGTFDRIVRGIDACLENQIPINLRMVADKENIDNLPELSQLAIDRSWTKSPWFKTQIGRNYELHHCQSTNDKLFSRISLFERISDLIMQYPHILQFYKPAYSVAKFLFENGDLPDPLFDSCPACKTEWAFDYTGKIYPCTATVGKAEESIGTFFPSVTRNTELIDEWERRDITSIEECKECNVQLACGGGCGSVAKNRTGNICSTDCRPVKELLEIGFSVYFSD